jgi:hypothetical protein
VTVLLGSEIDLRLEKRDRGCEAQQFGLPSVLYFPSISQKEKSIVPIYMNYNDIALANVV